jgi:hypothetical protein
MLGLLEKMARDDARAALVAKLEADEKRRQRQRQRQAYEAAWQGPRRVEAEPVPELFEISEPETDAIPTLF